MAGQKLCSNLRLESDEWMRLIRRSGPFTSYMTRRQMMKKFYLCLSFCSLCMLHGCFDNSQNTTKDNTDGTKSSVQMQEGKAEESK
jgi:hypothetical protein